MMLSLDDSDSSMLTPSMTVSRGSLSFFMDGRKLFGYL